MPLPHTEIPGLPSFNAPAFPYSRTSPSSTPVAAAPNPNSATSPSSTTQELCATADPLLCRATTPASYPRSFTVKSGASQGQSFPTSARACAGIARETAAAGESNRKQLLTADAFLLSLTPVRPPQEDPVSIRAAQKPGAALHRPSPRAPLHLRRRSTSPSPRSNPTQDPR
jgi:hypothetical protein